jgi:hypothetical protein
MILIGNGNLNNNEAANIETKFGAANFSYNPSKALTFSGFAILLGNKSQTQTNTITQRPDPLPDETKQNVTNQLSTQTLLKLSSSYVPSEKLHIDYDVLMKFSDQKEDQTLFSSVLADVYTNKNQNPLSLNQNFNYYYTLNDKNVFAFEIQHLFQEEDPFYNANLETQPFFVFRVYNRTNTK